MTTDLDEIRERYTADEVPPCRVCGGPLDVASMGGGNATEWACATTTTADADWLDHYNASRWKQYRSGDRRVLDLCDEVDALRAGVGYRQVGWGCMVEGRVSVSSIRANRPTHAGAAWYVPVYVKEEQK